MTPKTLQQSAMFKQILDALSTQFKGVDARVLTRMARKLAKTVKSEDEVDEAVQGVTIMDFIDLEGDRRATAAQKSAVENYEKKYNLKDGKPSTAEQTQATEAAEDEPTDDNDGGEPTAGVNNKKGGKQGNQNQGNSHESKLERQIAALTKTVSTLTGTITQMQQERTTKTRRQQYEALFEGADEKTKNRYMRNFDRLSFKDDEDFNNWLEEMTPEVTEELKGLGAGAEQGGNRQSAQAGSGTSTTGGRRGGTPPLGGRSTAQPGQVDAEVNAYLNTELAREQSNHFSTIAGLPNQQTAAPTSPTK